MWKAEEAEDEDSVHFGAGVEVGGDDREAIEGRHERGSLQLLARLSRLPPRDRRQPPHRNAQHQNHVRRHVGHQGPPLSLLFYFTSVGIPAMLVQTLWELILESGLILFFVF